MAKVMLRRIAPKWTNVKARLNDQAHFSVYGIAESDVNSFDFPSTIHPTFEKMMGRVVSVETLFHNCARRAWLLSYWQKRLSQGIALTADFRSPPVRQKSRRSAITSSKC
jgi:hypothetical protein